MFDYYINRLLAAIENNEPRQIIYSSPKYGDFGLLWKKDYSGLMARNPQALRTHQGFFDFIVLHGSRYEGKATHKDLFYALHTYSSYENCKKVWRGNDPLQVGKTDNEKEALLIFALMMLEQEVNWGVNVWQKRSFFNQNPRNPTAKRPRDMLMGFVSQVFVHGVDELHYWHRQLPGTVTFNGSFENYDEERKKYFTDLENDIQARALIIGRTYYRFQEIIDNAPQNPDYPPIRREIN